MAKTFGLRTKTYSCLIDDGSEDKKAKSTKKCVIKRKLKFEYYLLFNLKTVYKQLNLINCLEKNKIDIDILNPIWLGGRRGGGVVGTYHPPRIKKCHTF